MMYVDKDTLDIVSRDFLLKKHNKAKAKGQELTQSDLDAMNAAFVVDLGGDIQTGKAVLVGDEY